MRTVNRTAMVLSTLPLVALALCAASSQAGALDPADWTTFHHRLYAFDAAGCGHFSCPALWTGVTDASIVNSSPAVVDGVLYVGSGNRFFPDDASGRLYAFSLGGN